MSSTVFVRNLAYGTTQQQLEELFGDIGPVKKVSVIKDKGRAKTDMTTRGFAFVKLYIQHQSPAMESDAKLAMEKLNNSDYGGRKLCLGECESSTQYNLAKEKKGPKPLAHQKHPVADEQAAAHVATDATPASVEDDEPSKKHKKAKTPKSHTTEDVADDVDDDATTSKKEKRKAKKLLKHEVAADNQVAESAATIHEEVLEQVADKPANKDKSKKNKKKKSNDNDDEESPKVESIA
ncbi:hypothetical protein AaE_012359, partial [Aphanomyces astaci]